jgi:hypothetical protein
VDVYSKQDYAVNSFVKGDVMMDVETMRAIAMGAFVVGVASWGEGGWVIILSLKVILETMIF